MLLAMLSALWLGILTSISPCPLATNIAAVSYIGKNVTCPYRTVLSGFLYTFGRVLSYVLVGMLIVAGLLSVPAVATFLQEYMGIILGPVLIIVGIILLGIIKLNFSAGVTCGNLQDKASKFGILGAMLLGILFALSFCPISAALFFGSLISLSLEHNSKLVLPLAFGIGTGLPVILFAFIIAFSMNSVGKAYNSLVKFEFWMRKITGVIFILAGIFYVATHIFGFSM
ncbi:MAG TPA: aromatic aminobenezylarsenical efflux permease ArsG family transporter [Candidatus Gastranaerophilales bacterium]|nr:aromatic aminobenezylarsenical efflux permease ArsG family transporter [Candidatus Gastranaerophilales bacterium]